MSVTPVLLSSEIPSSSPIIDLVVVEAGGVPLVVCVAGRDDAAWTWDPQRDLWQKRPMTYAFAHDPLAAGYPDAENELNSLAAAVSGGRVLLAAGGHEQGSALWDLESGELLRGAMYGEPYVGSIATVKGEGPQRFVTGTDAGVEVWGLSAEEPPVELPDSDIHGICTVATAQINGRSLVVAGGSDVGVWDLARDGQLASFYPDDGSIEAVAVSQIADRPIVVAADPGQVYVWGLSEDEGDEPICDPLVGHEGGVSALDTAMVGDRSLAVTGGADATVRIWDLAEGVGVGAPLTGHRGGVAAVRTTMLSGREVALSAGLDGVIRVWDLAALVS
ncbi:WD40 repeat domain-containing protein [Streptomyces sp. NPDC002917]|uniref:WD40 repeat domain-containing protein n=1 Tax=Streptomyces sp. NPDC002917 TaxID=3364671 RepID=UPI0036D02408